MRQYLDLVTDVLGTGQHKPNRTGVDTISGFSKHYTVDLQEGFPLLTTKDLSGFRWNSLIHELLWYLSGEEHIRTLREETGIWDAWADDDGHLDTAYGRFWRRYPVPEEGLAGEAWPEDDHRWMNDEGTFDQLAYVLDTLDENPNSRRLVINAWHPANAAVSTLPPCHYTFVFNVQGDELNLHLTQRSGDIALGVPFNLAAYAILAQVVAQRAGFELGSFAHTIVDAHVYCGTGERGAWYGDHLDELQSRLADVESPEGYLDVREWLLDAAPEEAEGEEDYDHVPGLLLQASREPRERPTLDVADVPLEDLSFEDIVLRDYDPADGIRFAVAE
ncbi:thymidylate synthase [Haloferax gibbonsii]|uniref:Thymidylate synthase n=2 Tax=Haloferax gibbonsii TaxID=35746 RepID=A0A0K1IX70_HALGI|nr:thymidylate synthase [Haloferax gibbonsii]AKU08895.1 thymidylate synthase [Haloferax gibbonsii]ELZ81581.1 thymidylate synthase [Haloferax gibbonsii ATCC 33959]QOS11914.1 thymidylate synthase [Haloferax gibbonsii]